jgi:hypothetical protein
VGVGVAVVVAWDSRGIAMGLRCTRLTRVQKSVLGRLAAGEKIDNLGISTNTMRSLIRRGLIKEISMWGPFDLRLTREGRAYTAVTR